MTFRLRPIRSEDDPAIAAIIREVMTSYGFVGQGYSIADPSLDRMTATYDHLRSAYWVLESDDRVVGGGGFAQLQGALPEVCEVQKMYFLPEARGHGWGRKLLALILEEAVRTGFTYAYLETVTSLKEANHLYRDFGFRLLEGPMGNTGHSRCNRWYGREV